MQVKKAAGKKAKITPRKARVAAKAARKVFASKASKRTTAWTKGGREWSRVLGHFGIAE